jgi:hypothetical protein
MNKSYKFISIEQNNWRGEPEVFEGKPVYRIFNKKDGTQLGMISWYRPWKKYVFSTKNQMAFDATCLENILDFMKNHIKL